MQMSDARVDGWCAGRKLPRPLHFRADIFGARWLHLAQAAAVEKMTDQAPRLLQRNKDSLDLFAAQIGGRLRGGLPL
jgi:hypothetical protein